MRGHIASRVQNWPYSSTKTFNLLHGRICLKHIINIFLRLFERAVEYLHVRLFGEQKIWLWYKSSSRPSNFAPEMSFAVALFCCPRHVSQGVHALPQALPVIKKYFPPFCSIYKLLLISNLCKCTAYRYTYFHALKDFCAVELRRPFFGALFSVYGTKLLKLHFFLQKRLFKFSF